VTASPEWPPESQDRDIDWLINNFAARVPGIASVVVLSTDGLVLASSANIARDDADTLAAVTSGVTSLTIGASRTLGTGSVNQVIVEMDGGFLFVTTVSDGSALAVTCGPDCDIGLIGYEMSLLVARIGPVLTPALRAETRAELSAWPPM
jgi:predicted regulator of Ras-like GTPase activity (Roadblock/LC7/MglB family)